MDEPRLSPALQPAQTEKIREATTKSVEKPDHGLDSQTNRVDTTTTATTSTTLTTTSSRPISKYVRDFESLFKPIRAEMLKNKAQSGQLRHCQFRSLCWRYFLKCLPEQYNDWLSACEIRRRQYEALKKRNLSSIQPESVNDDRGDCESTRPPPEGIVADTDCLSSKKDDCNQQEDNDDDDSDYVKLSAQCDYKNVLRTIERDVVRTFPDMEFFRQTEMQEILSNILFNFATENPHLSYKQGMHELLATLLYVAHTDAQNCLINYEGDYANETIASLLNLKYLEHDVYLLFSHLMRAIETWYQNDEILPAPAETEQHINRSSRMSSSSSTSKLTSNRPQVGSVLGSKLMKISVNIVKSYDPELFYHLEALQIAPQIYGIRWMRLLFGREFEFLDLLTVWDAIICDQDSMSLVDYVFASMLITIREELVNGDYTYCLNNLMRYQFKDVTYVIKLALHLRDPISYSRPKPPNQLPGARYTGGAARSTAGTQKQYRGNSSHRAPHQMPVTSLTSKLSQQYISDKLQQVPSVGVGHRSQTVLNPASTRRFVSPTPRENLLIGATAVMGHNTDRQRVFAAQNRGDALSNVVQGGIEYLTQQASRNLSNANNSAKSKILPNINKFVTSIGQNIQDKTNFPSQAQWQNPRRPPPSRQNLSSSSSGMTSGQLMQMKTQNSKVGPHGTVPSSSSTHQIAQQQHHLTSTNDIILSADSSIIKEYEMREMQSKPANILQKDRFPLGKIAGFNSSNAFDVSTESYEDLHSIVDYCWRLLSEQIDSLQRCLPKEKGLHSEDEIFVALAQLKKVRDVLKGSLKLEDELESAPPSAPAHVSKS